MSRVSQRASEQFAVARSQNKAAATREEKMKELAAAFDSFSELKSNLTEGTKVHAGSDGVRAFGACSMDVERKRTTYKLPTFINLI